MVLQIDDSAFVCCGSCSVRNFDVNTTSKEYKELELIRIEKVVNAINKKNLAVAVITRHQAREWGDALRARGWQQIGPGVINSKTSNELQIWILDFTKRVIEVPKPPPPVNGFDAGGQRMDRRDEPRTFDVGPRTAYSESNRDVIKEHFMDVNGHRVLFVDLPVFNRGRSQDYQLNFYSIRLANGGGSYSWLQGGNHRFPTQRVRAPEDLVGDDLDIDDYEED